MLCEAVLHLPERRSCRFLWHRCVHEAAAVSSLHPLYRTLLIYIIALLHISYKEKIHMKMRKNFPLHNYSKNTEKVRIESATDRTMGLRNFVWKTNCCEIFCAKPGWGEPEVQCINMENGLTPDVSGAKPHKNVIYCDRCFLYLPNCLEWSNPFGDFSFIIFNVIRS